MTQATLQIPAKPTGLDMRVQINAIIVALLSMNAGPTAPGTTWPGMLWGDTTAGVLKRRNNADTAWVTIGPLDDFLGDLRTAISANASAAAAAASAAAAAQSTANSKMDNSSAAILAALGYTPVNPGSIPTFSGNVTDNEGGEIHLAKPAVTGLAYDAVMDVAGTALRFWEGGGSGRGATLDITRCGASVGSALALLSDIAGGIGNGINYTSNVAGTTYVNSSSTKHRLVVITLGNTSAQGQQASALVNGGTVPTVMVYTGFSFPLILLVPPGGSYSLSWAYQINSWVEYI